MKIGIVKLFFEKKWTFLGILNYLSTYSKFMSTIIIIER